MSERDDLAKQYNEAFFRHLAAGGDEDWAVLARVAADVALAARPDLTELRDALAEMDDWRADTSGVWTGVVLAARRLVSQEGNKE